VIATILLVTVASTIGAIVVLWWGGRLFGRDDVRLRSMRAAMEIDHIVYETRRKLIDAALEGRRRSRR
jgi:RecJ-like exonuclease